MGSIGFSRRTFLGREDVEGRESVVDLVSEKGLEKRVVIFLGIIIGADLITKNGRFKYLSLI